MKQNAYQQRSDSLAEIGFQSYADYLASDLWRGIRSRVLVRDQRRCVRCGSPATSVHHKAYDKETLLGVRLEKLASVCTDCHEYIEFDRRGKKQSLANANQTLHVATKKKRRKRKLEPLQMCPICNRRPARKERAGACNKCFLERPSQLPSPQKSKIATASSIARSSLGESLIAPRMIGVRPAQERPSNPLAAKLSTLRKSLPDNGCA